MYTFIDITLTHKNLWHKTFFLNGPNLRKNLLKHLWQWKQTKLESYGKSIEIERKFCELWDVLAFIQYYVEKMKLWKMICSKYTINHFTVDEILMLWDCQIYY